MASASYTPKNPAKAGWLFLGVSVLLVYTDLLYASEKLLILFVFFAFIPAFYVKEDFQHFSTPQRRAFKTGYVLTSLLTFLLLLGQAVAFAGGGLADRRFKWSELTLYYAIEESHFYEEAYVTFGKIGFSGIKSNRVFIQNCCGPNLLDEYNYYIHQ